MYPAHVQQEGACTVSLHSQLLYLIAAAPSPSRENFAKGGVHRPTPGECQKMSTFYSPHCMLACLST